MHGGTRAGRSDPYELEPRSKFLAQVAVDELGEEASSSLQSATEVLLATVRRVVHWLDEHLSHLQVVADLRPTHGDAWAVPCRRVRREAPRGRFKG